MQNKSPIGVFDSGIGGTSILKEIVKLLPNEEIIYLADSINAPYGQKTEKEIVILCKKNTEWLLKKGCKLIVVACNTATTNAIKILRSSYQIPFIGIEPAIKPAALNSKTHKIGVLATKGTLSSELFCQTSEKYSENAQIIEVVGKGLVEYIEKGDFISAELSELLKKYLTPLIKEGIDYLVLGCSHYPYLIPLIEEIVPNNIQIIDSGEAVAKQTKEILRANNLLNNSIHKKHPVFFTNKSVEVLQNIINKHFDDEKIYLIDKYL